MPPAGTTAAPRSNDRRDALAGHMLLVLRACAAIAEESLEQVAPTVSSQQFRALTVLHERGPQNAAAIADALGIARSTMTRLANRLVRDGLVERSTDPADRRVVVLTPTRLGDRTAERVKAWRLRELARRFAGIAPGDARALDEALSMVGSLLTQEEV